MASANQHATSINKQKGNITKKGHTPKSDSHTTEEAAIEKIKTCSQSEPPVSTTSSSQSLSVPSAQQHDSDLSCIHGKSPLQSVSELSSGRFVAAQPVSFKGKADPVSKGFLPDNSVEQVVHPPVVKTKAELKAERRATQEAQRVAKMAKRLDGGDCGRKDHTRKTPSKGPLADCRAKNMTQTCMPERSMASKRNTSFAHLRQHGPSNKMLSEIQFGIDTGSIVPKVMHQLGERLSLFKVTGCNRAAELLTALVEFIKGYNAPPDKDFCRDLDTEVTRVVKFLDLCRPLSVSMSNVVSFLKWKISAIPYTCPDCEARLSLVGDLAKFRREKIDKAREAIALVANDNFLQDNNIVIVYGYSTVIHKILTRTAEERKGVVVMVVDSRPMHEGKFMLRELVKMGLHCLLVPLTMVPFHLHQIKADSHLGRFGDYGVSKVLLGAHGVMQNSYVMSRVGTAMLAGIAHHYKIPVIVCFEMVKICSRSQTDSFVFNELGNADDVSNLPPLLHRAIAGGERKPDVLNVMYDVTPNTHITAYVTDIGVIPDSAVSKITGLCLALYDK